MTEHTAPGEAWDSDGDAARLLNLIRNGRKDPDSWSRSERRAVTRLAMVANAAAEPPELGLGLAAQVQELRTELAAVVRERDDALRGALVRAQRDAGAVAELAAERRATANARHELEQYRNMYHGSNAVAVEWQREAERRFVEVESLRAQLAA